MNIIDFKGDSLVTGTLVISKNSFNLPNSYSKFKFKKGKKKWRKVNKRYKTKKRKPIKKGRHSSSYKHKKAKSKAKTNKKKSLKRRHTFAFPNSKHCTVEFTV